MGGCSEGLYQGVPMIAVPQAVDQFGNAALLEQLGVGRHVPLAEATPERLRAALLELTGSAEVKARSAALRDELRAAGGRPGRGRRDRGPGSSADGPDSIWSR